MPVYKKLDTKYNVTLSYAGVENADADESYTNLALGSTVTLKAKEIEGKQFSCWSSDAEGKVILGTSNSYFMAVAGNATIYANYVNKDIEIKKLPVIAITNVFTTKTDTKNEISFSATRDIPDSYVVQEQGMIYGTGETFTEDTMVMGGDNVRKYVDASVNGKGVFILNVNVGAYVDTTVYVRGYIIVKDTLTGNIETYYSEISSGYFSELNN